MDFSAGYEYGVWGKVSTSDDMHVCGVKAKELNNLYIYIYIVYRSCSRSKFVRLFIDLSFVQSGNICGHL